MKKFILIFLTLILITSCEGFRFADGYVYESGTSNTLDSVKCEVVETQDFIFTDKKGHYYADGPFGGCVKECPDMTVKFSKQGYISKTVLNPGKDNIYLSK